MSRILLGLLTLRILASAFPGNDPAAEMQRRIDKGQLRLAYTEPTGYLTSLLKALNIPVSSQVLVFAKNSFQLHMISPDNPRAIYFNDDAYVAYVPGSDELEIGAIDPKIGSVYYMLNQARAARPQIKKQGEVQCLVCHDSALSGDPIPRLLMLSVLPSPEGSALKAASLITNDASPMRERWGGWYVTGTHGKQRHLGNTIVRTPANAIGDMRAFVQTMDLEAGANVTDLSGRFNTRAYLTPHSDLAALMILGHQTHVHNLMALAAYKETHPGTDGKSAMEIAEQVVRAMLFADEVRLTEPVSGTTSFAKEFSAAGPRDNRGRSLRDLDLKTRLMRFPLSYLIYTKSFDEMPPQTRQFVVRRLREILTGEDTSPDFAYLTPEDRNAILEILSATKPGWTSR